MQLTPAALRSRFRRTRYAATIVAVALGFVSVAAQFGSFPESSEGEIWELVQTLVLPAPPAAGPGFPEGSTFANNVVLNGVPYASVLYVTDTTNSTVIAYDNNGTPIDLPDAHWAVGLAEDANSPIQAWYPNQMATITVDRVEGAVTTPTTAILISDAEASASNRVFAFTTAGMHLFTLQLDSSAMNVLNPVRFNQAVNGVALGPGSKFILNGTTLELVGTFAAAWAEDWGGDFNGAVGGAVLAYRNRTFIYNVTTGEFPAPGPAVLRGNEGNPPAPHAREPFGVTFDPAGNLYFTDAVTERVTVYNPTPRNKPAPFAFDFTFGTPDGGSGTSEFSQSFGVTFVPDAGFGGGRLFIADAINNRVAVYRPDLINNELDFAFGIDGLDALDGYPFSVASDPLSGRLSVTNVFDNFGVWILQTPQLATFDLHVLDANNEVVETVCAAPIGEPSTYKVRFSLTVPPGRPPVAGVEPQLTVDGGAPALAAGSPNPVPGGTYPSSTIQSGSVMTYTYSLVGPDTNAIGAEIDLNAGATTEKPTQVLFRSLLLPVSDCSSPPPTISATPNTPPQLSGWTPVLTPPGQDFGVTLDADDDSAVTQIHYQILGANHTVDYDPVPNNGGPVFLSLPQLGPTTVLYRAMDDGNNWSKCDALNEACDGTWHKLDLLLWEVPAERKNAEGANISPFSLGPQPAPGGITFSATGLPGGLAIDPATGIISGTVASGTTGPYTVTVTESNGTPATTSVTFQWTITGGANRPPVAVEDLYSTAEDVRLTVPADGIFGLLENDSDPDNDSLSVRMLPYPNGEYASVGGLFPGEASDGSFVYIPPANYHGPVTFRYRANDGSLENNLSNVATVTINVTSVNDGVPVAVADILAAFEDRIVTYAAAELLDNDTDADNDTLAIASVTTGAGGTVVLNGDGTVTFSPALNFYGEASFSYIATDGTAPGNSARVTVNVAPANEAPVAAADTLAATEDTVVTYAASALLGNDTDVDGESLTIASVTSGAGGTAVLNQGGTVTFSPALNFYGEASFSYIATDGTDPSNSATVTVNVASVNDNPVAVNDTATVVVGASITIAVLQNDSDVDGTVTLVSVSNVSGGTATANPNGTVTFTAGAAVGPAGFTYTVTDGTAQASATVTVNLTPANVPPVCSAAFAPSILWPANHQKVYLSLSGVTDADGDAVTILFTGILQDEPTNSPGQGNTMQDGDIEDNGARAWVRAERAGTPNQPGDGRVYLVSFTATDPDGAACAGEVRLGVPHDQRGAPAVLSPDRLWNSITGLQVSGVPPVTNKKK